MSPDYNRWPYLLTPCADHELAEIRKAGCSNQSENVQCILMALLPFAATPLNGQLLAGFAFTNSAPPPLQFTRRLCLPRLQTTSEQNGLLSLRTVSRNFADRRKTPNFQPESRHVT